MKRKIILFLLNLIGGKKNQENEEEKGARRTGCGCLLAIAFAPFIPILVFIILIVWISSSLMSCAAPVVLSEVFGVEITEEDEKMLRGEYEEEKKRYGGVEEFFEQKKLRDTAHLAQAFYLLYMGQVLARPDTYLDDLAYCFADAVKLRNIKRIKERFGISMTEEDMDVVIEYARDTHIPTTNFRTYKNNLDLAKFAKYTTQNWKYRENTAGDILTIDQIYKTDNIDDWFTIGSRTADNTGVYKAYLWLNYKTGNIELTSTNTQTVQRYSTPAQILKASEEQLPIEDIDYVRCPGLGVHRKKDGQIGILTEEGVVIATPKGIEEVAFSEKDWDTVFFFPDVVYENNGSYQFCTIHVTVYSQKYSHANLELFGYHNHVVFPLYFVDGVAEVEEDFEVPDQRIIATLFWESSGLRYPFVDPEPEYGQFKEFGITRKDDYITITYVLD